MATLPTHHRGRAEIAPIERTPHFAGGLEPDTEASELRAADVWRTFVRNRLLIFATTAAGVGVAALVTWQQPRIYESATVLRVEDRGGAGGVLAATGISAAGGRGRIPTEMLVLRSRNIAEAAVDSLRLRLQVTTPAGGGERPVRLLSGSRDGIVGRFVLQRESDDTYTLRAEEGAAGVRLPRQVRVGVPFSIGDATLSIVSSRSAGSLDEIRFSLIPFRNAVDDVRSSLRVTRPEIEGEVVNIGYVSTDPELAAAVPNAVASAFIADKVEGTREESAGTVQFLREQTAAYKSELEAAENKLRGFRERQEVVSLTDEASEQVKRLASLQAERDAKLAERDALARLLARVEENSSRGGISPYRQLASFPVFLSNKAVQDMLQSLTELENERAKLLVGRTERNEDVRGTDTRIREIEQQLYEIAQNYLEGLNNQIGSAEQGLSRFRAQLGTIPAREVEFARLSREQQLIAEMYSLLQTRLKESEIRRASFESDVRVIDSALVPLHPVSPVPQRNLLLGLLVGLTLGSAGAFMREALDQKVRSRADAESASGGFPLLGVIPRFSRLERALGSGKPKEERGLIPVTSESAAARPGLVTYIAPRGRASEAYRVLRTNMRFTRSGQAPQMVVVASAASGEGKTSTAANLAVTLAEQGTRTLLLDADLRGGTVHQLFGVPQEPGLVQAALGRVPIEGAIREIEGNATPLNVLTSGAFPANPAEFLSAERMRTLLAELRERYDMIIIDTPPLAAVTDASILAMQADAMIVVARAGLTDRALLQHVVTQLYHMRAPLAGIVLNDVEGSESGVYPGYIAGQA